MVKHCPSGCVRASSHRGKSGRGKMAQRRRFSRAAKACARKIRHKRSGKRRAFQKCMKQKLKK